MMDWNFCIAGEAYAYPRFIRLAGKFSRIDIEFYVW